MVAAGERWPDNSLRPALEDLVGAGAVIAGINAAKSPDAMAAQVVYEQMKPDLAGCLRSIASGAELVSRGFAADVEFAAELNVSRSVPVLVDGCF